MQGLQPRPKRKIRLTYLITDLKVGGVPLHLYRLATSLPRSEFDVRVVALSDEGPVGRQLREADITVQACNARSPRDFAALGRLWALLMADPPDLLHALLFHANTAARLVGPLAGIGPRRVLCEIQTAEIERGWHLLVDGLTCRLCRLEIGNSPSVVEHLHTRARIPRARLRCQWGCVDLEPIAHACPLPRSELGIAPDESFLLWTGRLDPVKGFEEMLDACRKLKDHRKFKLALAGDGPYRPTVERLVRSCQLQERVLILGQRRDIPRLLKAADLFVFCSRTEGLPNSLLEAMAASLPIVATDVPGCRDLIRHMESGLLVESQSADSLAAGLERLLEDPRLARRLGRNAHDWVARHADARTWIRRWREFYQELLPLPFAS